LAKITINDVAEAAGVSIKTVSRVMNKEANVSPATQLKVQKVIDKLGYLPSPSARSLAGKHTYIIGLIYSNITPSYIYELQTGALATCREEGYDLLIYPCDSGSPQLYEEVSLLHKQQKVDGMILTPPLTDYMPLITKLKQEKANFINISPIHHDPDIPDVHTNEQQAANALTQHLLALGHKKIGIILGPLDHAASINRLAGFKQALSAANITFDNKYIMQGLFDFESGKACTEKLLNIQPRPTAIFACNDAMAAGAMSVAYERGMTLPQDLSIIGFDDSPTASRLKPTLTTVKQPTRELAKNAAEILINNVRNRIVSELPPTPKCELIIRESTAKNLKH